MPIVNRSHFTNYRPLVSGVGLRINDQYFDKKPLSIDDALDGFSLNPEERAIMIDFAQQAYDGTRLEKEAEVAYWEQASPHTKKSALVITIGGVGVGLVTYALTKDAVIGIASGLLATLLGAGIEEKYRYLTSLFSCAKRRKFGDTLIQLGKETLRQLDELAEHSDDYLYILTMKNIILH